MRQYNEEIATNTFDAFYLENLTNKNALYFLMMNIWGRYDFQNSTKMDKRTYQTLVHKVQGSYQKNPYHNQIHAADIVQSLFMYVFKCDIARKTEMTPLELFSIYISAAAHDINHP